MSKTKKLYWFMTSSAIISIILFAVSAIYATALDTWIPMIVMACTMTIMLVLTLIIYIKYVKFTCPKCNQIFKPSASDIFWAMHTPTKRLLKCPHCDTKSWCKEHFD